MEPEAYIDRRRIPRFSARFIAAVIDRMVVVILAAFYVDRVGLKVSENLFLSLLPVATVIWVFYKGLMESHLCQGQTIGRAIQHIRVMDSSGDYLPLMRSFYRGCLEALFMLVPPALFFDLACWIVDRHDHRTLLDQMSDSLVVETESGESLVRVRAVTVGLVLVVGFIFYHATVTPSVRISSSLPPSSKTFLQELLDSALEGDPSSQVILGNAYYTGKEFPQDYKAAAKWFKRAANQGNARAKYQLAVLYASGKGVPKDFSKALGLLKEAADGGDDDAKTALSKLATLK